MSKTSKSPKKVAQAAYQVALATLPDYAHRFSPQKFSQPQLFVCLVLKIFFKTDYRGIVEILRDSPDVCKIFHLTTIPHYTTLQKVSKRLLTSSRVNQLLETTVTTFRKNKHIKLAAVDSTGLEAGHISRYFVQRKRSKELETHENVYYRRFPKLAVVSDCFNHMVLSLFTSRGPSVDVNQFCKIVKSTAEQVTIETLLADAGYDSEANHQYAREVHHIQTLIPAKQGRSTTKLPASKYRRMMRTDFNKTLYGQRWQVETVFSMIKRNQGEALRAKGYWAQNREMMLKVLTHNIGIIRFVNELFYRASLNLFKLAAKGLFQPLRTAIYKAKGTKHTVKIEAEEVKYNGRRMRVNVTVIPVKSGPLKEEFFLVLFDEIPRVAWSGSLPKARGKSVKDEKYVETLQKELSETKEYLQTVIEEQENVNEEIKTANEEILSSNEELLSTNEELETAKEELQSSNEELVTTNEELQNRNKEVVLLNNDLINLLSSINMPIIMMGTDLVIRRITPQAEKVLNVIPSDIGRPINKIRLNVDIPDFEKILLDVIESLHAKTFEIKDKERNWYSVYIRPYRTLDNKINGVIAIFVNITEGKRAEQRIEWLSSFPCLNPLPVLEVGRKGEMYFINAAAQRLFPDLEKKKFEHHFLAGIMPYFDDPHKKEVKYFSREIEIGNCWYSQIIILPGLDRMRVYSIDITGQKQIEKELAKAKEEEFRAVFDNAVDGILIVDTESKKFYMGNKSVCRMLGYNPEEIKDLSVMDIHPKKDLPYVMSQFEKQAKGDFHLAKNLPIKRKDGGIFYADINAMTTVIAGKVYLVKFFRDTASRKQAEDLLRKSEDKYRSLFVSSRDAIMTLEPPSWRYTSGNPATIKMFGAKDEAEFSTYTPWKLSPEHQPDGRDSHEKATEMIETAMRGGSHFFEWTHKRANGERFFANVLLSKVEQGEKVFLLSSVRDVTDQKQASLYARSLIESSLDPFVTISQEGKITDVNEATVKAIGVYREKLIGTDFSDYFTEPKKAREGYQQVFAKGFVSDYPLTIRRKDGKRIDVLYNATVYKDFRGNVLGVFAAARDVTEQKRMEKELKNADAQKASSEIKSKFTSMVSHELRSPLGSIKEGINLVLEGLAGTINDEQKDLLDTAKRNTDRLGRLINDVLDFQKMESGKMEFDIRENDMNETVREVHKAMGLLAKEMGLDLVVEADDSMPRARFDKDKIIQVLTNLVSNAVKYTEKGNITIRTKREDDAVHVIVQDTGIGIKLEDMGKLFRVFEQLDSTRDKKKGGTGLGLAISSEIILAHKGKIWAESTEGRGSAFHFTIPVNLKNKKKIGEILVEEGKITEKDFETALNKQRA